MLALIVWWILFLFLGVDARDSLCESSSVLQDLEHNIDHILDDDRLFKEYYQCLVNLGPCNDKTSSFKDFVQEALEKGCARCSADQQLEAIDLLQQVMECRPREYAEIERQYDPSGTFKKKYKASLMAKNYKLWQEKGI